MKQAGYLQVNVLPLPGCSTDMIVEARKSRATIVR
jgi:hypothetical protein